jgi:IclR family acetate operon transcriptional repressor
MKSQPTAAVKSAARALDTVQFVALHGPVNARAIGRATGIPESSLSYLLATLLDRGWLVQGPDRAYSCGPVLRQMASGAPLPLLNRATVALGILAANTGETACFFVRQGYDIEMAAIRLSDQVLRFTPQRGMRMPLHSFAAGKAILAALSGDELDTYFASGARQRFTAHTLTEENALRGELHKIRSQGYALSYEEHTVGVIGLGVAVDGQHALSLAVPSPRFTADLERSAATILKGAVGELVGAA